MEWQAAVQELQGAVSLGLLGGAAILVCWLLDKLSVDYPEESPSPQPSPARGEGDTGGTPVLPGGLETRPWGEKKD